MEPKDSLTDSSVCEMLLQDFKAPWRQLTEYFPKKNIWQQQQVKSHQLFYLLGSLREPRENLLLYEKKKLHKISSRGYPVNYSNFFYGFISVIKICPFIINKSIISTPSVGPFRFELCKKKFSISVLIQSISRIPCLFSKFFLAWTAYNSVSDSIWTKDIQK